MDHFIRAGPVLLLLMCTMFIKSEGYAIPDEIPSPMDPIEKCIYTCDYCYQNRKLVQCANECIATVGLMENHWVKTCPELHMPLYFVRDVDFEKIPGVVQT